MNRHEEGDHGGERRGGQLDGDVLPPSLAEGGGGRDGCALLNQPQEGNHPQGGNVRQQTVDGEGGGRVGLHANMREIPLGMEGVPPPPPPPPPPGVKLAIVSGEAGVQLFDVGLHNANEVVEPRA